ncbi:AP-1 complex subunit gamma-1 [Drechslerella stenobrocha 248]|uniref:AP-1 complex subunit gamma n=1 Tax=Drechslerella stenobrocha 248 TaxID=1043628 RepID=W7HVI3_9PEZI|nr:AP-1 complex subunit gamma-1 [Drechslerella stenobrocha 248]
MAFNFSQSSMKQFIRAVRASKTIADERAVIQKESAAIRASFREESADPGVRRNNVAKLLYLFTLGERTHFGQIECLKLLASPRFADKRLGYLGTMLLLDENQEVLTLVTNSLKNDLNHSNQYVVGLALCTLGNIASTEMARDLFQEIESLLSTANPYIRKKAALCAMRIVRKVPDLQEHFIDKTKLLLQDRNHGVLLCGLTLIIDLCIHDPDIVEEFKQYTPILVKQLKALTTAGYAPEHDVTGITDPFLQVKILQLLRALGKGDSGVSEQINDILAQVATNTDSTKNVGNSILYEAVLTILDIEADSGLRVLGINILGKFLSNKDNNIRYVALNTLIKVVNLEPNAVQRHRNTILDCLRDPDISIRRRALDLSFTLINESNIRVLIRELLAFLEVANNEFKPAMTTQICIAAEKFAPNKRWHIDTVLRVLKLAGNFVKEQILSSFIRLIATSTPDQQTYSAQKLYSALRTDITQEALTLAGAWLIGEYGDLLLKGGAYEEDGAVQEVRESDIVDLLTGILDSAYVNTVIHEYIMTSLMKLTTRITDASQVERIRRVLTASSDSLDVEIQQRSVEYGNLFGYDGVRRGVLEKMPPPEARTEDKTLTESASAGKKAKAKVPAPKPKSGADDLLDLLNDDAPANPAPSQTNGHADILNLFDSTSAGASPSQPQQATSVSNIMDLFGSSGGPAPAPAAASVGLSSSSLLGELGGAAPPSSAPAPSGPPAHPVYNKNNVSLTLGLQRNSEGIVALLARFQNLSFTDTVAGVSLQAAVPKSQKLQLMPISSTEIPAQGEATQQMRVQGSQKPPLRLRLRIAYSVGANNFTDQVDWSEPV